PVLASAGLVVAALAGVAARLERPRGARWGLPLFVVGVLGVVVAAAVGVDPVASGSATVVGRDYDSLLGGVAGAAALWFFAIAGFDRVVPSVERGDDSTSTPEDGGAVGGGMPGRGTVAVGLGVVAVVQAALLAGALHQLGADRLALAPAPLLDLLVAADATPLSRLVRLAAALAALAVLVPLLRRLREGVRVLAVERELPRVLAGRGRGEAVGPPEPAVAVLVLPPLLLLDPATSMAVAACLLLVHYAFVNAAARVLMADERHWPMRLACTGMFGSVILALSLPVAALVVTGMVLLAGFAVLTLWARWRHRSW
ncbi:hypothetical protein, partial [Actinoalloteichus spitiensis]|uniref:hypothetical protein n=1 Tax=Actinoalloteichus spitiensis TaxID=252394 RepID=UPI0003808109